MTENFDSIHLEVYIDSAWVDIYSDMKKNPPPKWNGGIMENGVLDRTGDPGYFSCHLKNGEDNSAGLIGYYSPGHTNALSGWGTGLKIRYYFIFEGRTFVQFIGWIEPDGINVAADTKGMRTVKVSAHDFMAKAAKHEMKLLEFAENKKLEDVAALILANMTLAPESTSYGTGSDTFPFVFDTVSPRTRALAEFQKAALSEWGFVYTKPDGTFVTEGRAARTNTSDTLINRSISDSGFWLREDGDYWLREDGDKWVRDETQSVLFDNVGIEGRTKTSYGKDLANRIEGISYPRRVDAAATTILAALQKSFKIEAGTTKENYRMSYVDPDQKAKSVTGRDMVTPVATTHYTASENEDGTGADYTSDLTVTATFGIADVEYDLQNTGANDIWVQKLDAVGKGVYIFEPVATVYKDTDSQDKHGVFTLKFDMKYQDDPTLVETFSQLTLAQDKDPHTSLDQITIEANRDGTSMYGFLQLVPGTRAAFKEDMNAIDGSYYIMGYDAQLINGKYVFWSPILRDVGAVASSAWIWDQSTWDETTYWSIPT